LALCDSGAALEMIVFSVVGRSCSSTASGSEKIALKWVGTMKTLVAAPLESRRRTSSASNFARISTLPPKKMGARANDRPAPWYMGAIASARSSGP
jgi:hypothetical protein